MNRMVLLVIAAACFGGAYLLDDGNDAGLEVLAGMVNDSSPSMPDSETRIESASVDGNVLTYHMTLVDIDKEDLDVSSTQSRLQAKVIRGYCDISLVQKLLKHGDEVHFSYQDQNGDALTEVAIDAGACGIDATDS